MRLLDAQYTAPPFYGTRRMTAWLRSQGYAVNRKRVTRLMRQMGMEAIYTKPQLSQPGVGHKIYPYLLRGVKIERVPYKASPQALGDVMSGQCQVMFPDLPQGLAQIDAGKVRGLGTTGPQRTSVAPNLPAIAETVPGYSLVYWLAVFAPAGTPMDVQKTLADAIAEAMKDPATGKAMTQGRMEISPLPLEQFAAYVKEQTTWWTTEIKAAGIEPE